jgi:hypothetical protein
MKKSKNNLFPGATDPEIQTCRINDLADVFEGDLICLVRQPSTGAATIKVVEFVNQKFKCRVSLIEDDDGEMRAVKRGRLTKSEIADSLVFKINVKECLIGCFEHIYPKME